MIEDGVLCGAEFAWETELLRNLVGMLEGVVLGKGEMSGDGGGEWGRLFGEFVL